MYNYNTGTSSWPSTPNKDLRFLYDRWNLIMVIRAFSSSSAVVSKFTWGLDLSGQNGNVIGTADGNLPGLHGAGGAGGLLAMHDCNTTATTADDHAYIYFYDANGNVCQLVDATLDDTWDDTDYGDTVAKYEYYPFGGQLRHAGPAAGINPFQFSTKYRDQESALYYYGHRYHKPRHGRWISRDPIGEKGGKNLYCIAQDNPISNVDFLGLFGPGDTIGADFPQWCLQGPVKSKFKRHRVRGTIRQGIRGQKITEIDIDTEVDFEILTSTNVSVEGVGPDAAKTGTDTIINFDLIRFKTPEASQVKKGSLNEDLEPINVTGVACRMKQICVRECAECNCTRSRMKGRPVYTGRVGCVFGDNAQWLYGVIKDDAFSEFYCSPYPAGKVISMRGTFGQKYFIQPGNLSCDENSVKSCKDGSVQQCTPNDPRW